MSETFREGSADGGGLPGQAGGSGSTPGGTFREGPGAASGGGVNPGGTAREGGPAGAGGAGGGFVRVSLLPCLAGSFEVVRDLGSGGEADVLLASDPEARLWVVKQYRQPGWSADGQVMDALLAARAGQTLVSWRADASGRHVLWLQQWGTDPATGLFYEVQEFVPGGSLERLDAWPVSELAAALVSTVAVFHEVVGAHRDVKPANVLVRSADGPVLVLADVGLARAVGAGSKRFSKRDGSAAYQGPEAAQGLVSRAGDWWSVGMMIAQAALGYHPLALPDGSLPGDQVIATELAQRDVPHLDRISDDRVRLLCQGLLTRDADQRWAEKQIRAWQDGQNPPTGYRGANAPVGGATSGGGRVRSVRFGGAEHDSPAALAAAFAADPQRAGAMLFEQKHQVLLEDLRVMLRSAGLHEAQGVLDSYRSGSWEPTLLRLLVEMDAGLSPVLGGQSMTPADVAGMAQQAINAGTISPEQQQTLVWVIDHELWLVWRGLPGMADASDTAELLPTQSRVNAVFRSAGIASDGQLVVDTDLVDAAAQHRIGESARPLAAAWMVLGAAVPGSADQVLAGVIQAARPGALGQAWWVRLADSRDPLERIVAVAAIGLATTAQTETDARQRVQRRAQEKLLAEQDELRELARAQKEEQQTDAYTKFEATRKELRERLQSESSRFRVREEYLMGVLVELGRARQEAQDAGLVVDGRALPSSLAEWYRQPGYVSKAKLKRLAHDELNEGVSRSK